MECYKSNAIKNKLNNNESTRNNLKYKNLPITISFGAQRHRKRNATFHFLGANALRASNNEMLLKHETT